MGLVETIKSALFGDAIEEPISQTATEMPTKLNPPADIDPFMVLKRTNGVWSINNTGRFRIALIQPNHFEEATKMVNMLKDNKPVITSFESTKGEEADRIFSFMSGATYAVGGKVQKISNNIYIFTAKNVILDINEKITGERSHWD